MSSTNCSINKPSKKPKLNIIPPRALFVDLTLDDTMTPSPQPKISSPSAPNAPSKTPSTHATSSSSIECSPKPPTHINKPTPSSPRILTTLPPLENLPPSQNIPLTNNSITISPITPLEANFSPPLSSTPIPPPILQNQIPWNFLEAHGESCLCCIHNRNLIFGLREELEYMFSFIEQMLNNLSQQNAPSPLPPSEN